MCMNQLQMNDTKIEFITFSTSHLFHKKNFDAIAIGGTAVGCLKPKIFLCALVDDTLSVQQHMAAHASLALSRIHLMQYVKTYLTTVTTKMVMCSLVLFPVDCKMCIITKHLSK